MNQKEIAHVPVLHKCEPPSISLFLSFARDSGLSQRRCDWQYEYNCQIFLIDLHLNIQFHISHLIWWLKVEYSKQWWDSCQFSFFFRSSWSHTDLQACRTLSIAIRWDNWCQTPGTVKWIPNETTNPCYLLFILIDNMPIKLVRQFPLGSTNAICAYGSLA